VGISDRPSSEMIAISSGDASFSGPGAGHLVLRHADSFHDMFRFEALIFKFMFGQDIAQASEMLVRAVEDGEVLAISEHRSHGAGYSGIRMKG